MFLIEFWETIQKAGAGRCSVCLCRGREMLTLTGEIVGRCKRQFEKENPADTSFIQERKEEIFGV